AVGPKTRELKGGVQSLMGLMRLIVRNAEKRWSLDLVSSAISTAARIIRNAPAPLTSAGTAHEILQILRAGKTRPGGGLQTASDLRKNPYAKCRVRLAYIRQLIPSPHEGDSRGGFSKRGGCDSPWQTGGGLPWLLRLGFEGITTPRDCASWRSGLRMPIRRGACWRWRRSTMAGLEPRRRRSAALGCKRCATGCWHSTLRGRRACKRQGTGQRAAAHPSASAGVAGDRRERSDPGGSW